MGNVCLPVARHFLSRELQEWVPGVPQASSCRSPGCHECFTAFIASHSCDCVLRDLMLKFAWDFICLPVKDSSARVDSHQLNTLFPRPLWHADGITELLGKAALPQQGWPQLCWVIRCEGLHPHDLWAAPEELLSACRLSWAVTLTGTRGGCVLSIL